MYKKYLFSFFILCLLIFDLSCTRNDIFDISSKGAYKYPNEISSLYAWYKADSGVTVVSGVVTAWTDSSSNGYDLTVSMALPAPPSLFLLLDGAVNGKPAIRFPAAAVGNYFFYPTASVPQPITVMLVMFSNPVSAYIFESSSNGLSVTTNSSTFVTVGANIPIPYGNITDWATSGFSIVTVIFNSTQSELYINGVLVSSGDAGNVGLATEIRFGANGSGSSTFDGLIAEVAIFSSALTSRDRGLVENYLSMKYSID